MFDPNTINQIVLIVIFSVIIAVLFYVGRKTRWGRYIWAAVMAFAVLYTTIILTLGFGIMDDYFLWTFPSWPVIIKCFEGCGAFRLIVATIINGIMAGSVFSLIAISILKMFRIIFSRIKSK